MKALIKKLLCKIRGHRYGASYFSLFTLSFCTCCGKEIADRTFDELLAMPDDYEPDWD